jgi:hypothetical protein
MSIPRILCLAIGAILIPAGAVTAATVTYDGGTLIEPNRPVSVVGIDINSILYDVTFTYNNDASVNPLRVGSLPDTDIPLARTGLAALLNTQSVDSNFTILFFQPNVDTNSFPAFKFESQGSLLDVVSGVHAWYDDTEERVQFGVQVKQTRIAFAQFAPSIVPEPSAIAGCLGLVGMGLLIGWRRKSNRKKK